MVVVIRIVVGLVGTGASLCVVRVHVGDEAASARSGRGCGQIGGAGLIAGRVVGGCGCSCCCFCCCCWWRSLVVKVGVAVVVRQGGVVAAEVASGSEGVCAVVADASVRAELRMPRVIVHLNAMREVIDWFSDSVAAESSRVLKISDWILEFDVTIQKIKKSPIA